MIIVMAHGHTPKQREAVQQRIEELGYKVVPIFGVERTVLAAVGHEDKQPLQNLASMPGVEAAIPIMKPFKLASSEYRDRPTIVNVKGETIGGQRLAIMAGPCAVESPEQIMECARIAKQCGAGFLRGGAFKPRTSPYSFQGMEDKGLELLREAGDAYGLKVVTEMVGVTDLEAIEQYADMIQIGARNSQNYALLKAAGRSKLPVLLKRGMAMTVKEFLMSAEYVLAEGNQNVVLCERGIRTFEDSTRNTLDLNAIPVLKSQCHLPVIADPSHGTGVWQYVTAMARAAVAAGADGLLIEIHPQPDQAVSDGPQSLKPKTFAKLMEEIQKIAEAIGRKV
ncbi:MAG: 3-deoxy-7-phosphoheptulonate synthase [Candidatus Sumerlaeota bacterium]|nr:3-deoxy-7-phosphoheptulonate synthase [Candidatus Sumerlaeota bacterium]